MAGQGFASLAKVDVLSTAARASGGKHLALPQSAAPSAQKGQNFRRQVALTMLLAKAMLFISGLHSSIVGKRDYHTDDGNQALPV
jgi:ferric-dicitrate binding protein FerR (iron transport regulator)